MYNLYECRLQAHKQLRTMYACARFRHWNLCGIRLLHALISDDPLGTCTTSSCTFSCSHITSEPMATKSHLDKIQPWSWTSHFSYLYCNCITQMKDFIITCDANENRVAFNFVSISTHATMQSLNSQQLSPIATVAISDCQNEINAFRLLFQNRHSRRMERKKTTIHSRFFSFVWIHILSEKVEAELGAGCMDGVQIRDVFNALVWCAFACFNFNEMLLFARCEERFTSAEGARNVSTSLCTWNNNCKRCSNCVTWMAWRRAKWKKIEMQPGSAPWREIIIKRSGWDDGLRHFFRLVFKFI